MKEKQTPYLAAMDVQTPEEAEAMVLKLIELALAEVPTMTRERAREIQLMNIGYFTGYLSDRAEQRRVLHLYGTEHPIFGSFDEEMSPDKAFKAGTMLGSVVREGGHITPEAIAAAREIIRQP